MSAEEGGGGVGVGGGGGGPLSLPDAIAESFETRVSALETRVKEGFSCA